MADVRRDGRLLEQRSTGDVQTFDPQDSKITTLGKLPTLVGGILRAPATPWLVHCNAVLVPRLYTRDSRT